jgi:hypothetical protein
MDAVVEDALREVARAEAALADAEAQLREAWAQRLGAFRAAGWTVVYVHEHRAEAISQRVVVEDERGEVVDLDRLTAMAAG